MYTRVAISALADGLVVRPLAGAPQLDTPCLPCPGRMLSPGALRISPNKVRRYPPPLTPWLRYDSASAGALSRSGFESPSCATLQLRDDLFSRVPRLAHLQSSFGS